MPLLGDLFNASGKVVMKTAEAVSREAASFRLSAAIRSGNTAQVASLLGQGADTNRSGKGGDTPLILAARHGGIDILRLLLEKGAEPNRANYAGDTPLFCAIRSYANNEEMVRLLLRHEARVARANHRGETPLYAAVDRASTRITMLVADRTRKEDIDRAPRDGDTPLVLAVRRGYAEIVYRLLEAGANPEQKSRTGEALVQIAERSLHKAEIIPLLQAALAARALGRAEDERLRQHYQRAAAQARIDSLRRLKRPGGPGLPPPGSGT